MAFQFINVFWISVMGMFSILAALRGLKIQANFESSVISSVVMRRQMDALYYSLVGMGAGLYLGLCAVQSYWPDFYKQLLGKIFQHMSQL